MLVMISQPMNGRTNLDIKNERAEVIEKLNKLHIDVLDTVFEEEAPVNSNQGAYFLAKAIDAMSRVDAVYFMKDWQNARGCRIERQVAKEYGIKILDTDFLYEEATVKRIIPTKERRGEYE